MDFYNSDSDSDFEMMLQEEEADDQFTMSMAMAIVQASINAADTHLSRNSGSVMNHRVINRSRAEGHERLYRDYFADNPVYTDYNFRRRFRMHRPLFLRILNAVEAYDPFFVQRRNSAGNLGLSSLQKVIAAMRMLAYGVSADSVDDYVRIGESTAIESLKKFVKAIVVVFGNEYLRSPNNTDLTRLLAIGEQR